MTTNNKKSANKYTVRKSGKNAYTLMEDGFFIDEYPQRSLAERRARQLNLASVPGWKDRSVFVGADEEEEEV